MFHLSKDLNRNKLLPNTLTVYFKDSHMNRKHNIWPPIIILFIQWKAKWMIKRHDEKLNGPLLFDLIHNVIEAYNSTVTPNIENDAILRDRNYSVNILAYLGHHFWLYCFFSVCLTWWNHNDFIAVLLSWGFRY
jgi:hypothetical protein